MKTLVGVKIKFHTFIDGQGLQQDNLHFNWQKYCFKGNSKLQTIICERKMVTPENLWWLLFCPGIQIAETVFKHKIKKKLISEIFKRPLGIMNIKGKRINISFTVIRSENIIWSCQVQQHYCRAKCKLPSKSPSSTALVFLSVTGLKPKNEDSDNWK